MIFNQTEKEEKAYLMDIIALLAANIEQMDKAIEDKSKDVMEHKLYLWENLSELDRAEKSAVRQIVTQQVAASESLAEQILLVRALLTPLPPLPPLEAHGESSGPQDTVTGHLRAGTQAEPLREGGQQAGEVVAGKRVGTAAAEMDMAHRQPAFEPFGDRLDLPPQHR